MKITLIFKTPDVMDRALEQLGYENYNEDDLPYIKDFLRQYIKYDEYINVEFDIENKTVQVLKK